MNGLKISICMPLHNGTRWILPTLDSLLDQSFRDIVARNFVGLVQIRNFGCCRWLVREIRMLLKHRWLNVFAPDFWLFSLGCPAMPPSLLLRMVDRYKKNMSSKSIGTIPFPGATAERAAQAQSKA